MPLLNFELIEGRTEAELKTLLDAAHRAMVAAFKVPERDRFQIVHEHKRSQMIILDRGLGIERSDKVVVVQVTSTHQHERSEKLAFYKNLCEELERACGISPSDVMVTIFDISDDGWSLGLGRAQMIDLGSANSEVKIIYTEFPKDATKPIFTKPPAPVGTVEYNEWLGRMFSGVLCNESSPEKQKEIADQIMDEGYVQHNKLVETGRKGLLAFMRYVFQAVPDTRFVVHDVFATKDRVVTRWTWTGTLKGDGFLGVAPKGQRIEFDGIDIWSVRNGKLYEHWDEFDWPRALIELGVRDLPEPFYGVASQPYSR
jgi:predicted ester cyclase/phenylpyruvate tautomerase PptA (4-oxalocrotonate tautomerase family)